MKIRFLESISGPDGTFGPGDETDWDSTEAKRFIEAGVAEAVKPARKSTKETAAKIPRRNRLDRIGVYWPTTSHPRQNPLSY